MKEFGLSKIEEQMVSKKYKVDHIATNKLQVIRGTFKMARYEAIKN